MANPIIEKMSRTARDAQEGRALTVDKQWSEIQQWRDYLEDIDDVPALESMCSQWSSIKDATGMDDDEYGRGSDLSRTAGTPLAALFYFIDMGFYPPPELLLGLHDAWLRYIGSNGKLSLEDTFLGPSQKGGGNFAKRRNAKLKKIYMTMNFCQKLREGKSRIQAAEEISTWLGGKPDPDSILRMMRGIGASVGTRRDAEK